MERCGNAGHLYWEANMELIDIIPEFNLYEEFWKIYTKADIIRPQYISNDAVIDRSLISEGAEIYGEVHNSVIGADVIIEEGAIGARFHHYASLPNRFGLCH